MACRNLGTDPCLAHGYNGIAETDNINALFEHAACKLLSTPRTVEHYRNHWMGAFGNIEAGLSKLLT